MLGQFSTRISDESTPKLGSLLKNGQERLDTISQDELIQNVEGWMFFDDDLDQLTHNTFLRPDIPKA